MSSKVIAIVVALAIALAGVTLLLIQSGAKRGTTSLPGTPGGRLAAGERLLDIDPSKVTQVVLSRSGAADTLSRQSDGTWTLLTGGGGASAARSWPLDESRINGALRLLLEARAIGTVDDTAKVDDGGVTIALTVSGSGTHQIRLASTTLGGQGLVEIAPPVGPGSASVPRKLAAAPDALHKAFFVGAPKLWRRSQLLSRVAQDATAILLVSRAGALALRKSQGAWNLIEPIGGPANVKAVEQLIATLDSLTIARYFDDDTSLPAEVRTQLDSPQARILIEMQRPGAGAPAPPTELDLRLGPTIDINERLIAAALGDALYVGLKGDRLESISPDPTHYLNPAATIVRPEDVGRVTISVVGAHGAASRTFKRVVDGAGWAEVREGEAAGEVLQTRDRAEAVNGVLQFVCALPAASIKLETPSGYEPTGSILLASTAGAPLDKIEIGKAPGSAVWTRTNTIHRGYSFMPPMLPALMPEILGVMPPPAPVPGAPADVNK